MIFWQDFSLKLKIKIHSIKMTGKDMLISPLELVNLPKLLVMICW